jgi:Protein of unknown function, DUF547
MKRYGLFVAMTCFCWQPSFVQAGPTVTVGAVIPANAQVSMDRIDHSSWDGLVRKYVDAQGFVDYASWKTSANDVKALDDYLAHLSAARAERTTPKAAQLAFWINAYNAVTVKGILREYPTTSIRNHTAKIYGYNIWKDMQLQVSGQAVSLDAMEHQILRKMGEPRIHFAIVCASIGCPRLLNEAYSEQNLEQQLTVNTQAFFADVTKCKVDARSGALQLSPILQWFGEDFGADEATRLKTITPYLPEAAQGVVRGGRARVSYLDYDWGLNDQAVLKPASRR